jgi:colanic acid/amylovoran biosynthesis protein
MAHLCDRITHEYGAKIVFVPHVLYQGNNDREIATEIINRMQNKGAVIIKMEANPMRVKYVISKLALMISPRMHPIIHALSSGVPVIAIDYNKKTREVMKLFDKEEWVIDLANLDDLPRLVDSYFIKRETGNAFYEIKKMRVTEDYVQVLRNTILASTTKRK